MNISIEGLRSITGPRDQNRVRGRLTMPKEADSRLYAFKWVEKGVPLSRAKDDEEVIGTNYRVDGWQLWKSKAGQTHSRALKSKIYVLMFRPIQLQQTLQKIYGNVSRERTINEATGRTVAGETPLDRGMLVDTTLEQVERAVGTDSNEELVSGLRLNSLTSTEPPPQGTVSGRATTKTRK